MPGTFGKNPCRSLIDACMWGRVRRPGEDGARSDGVSRAALAGRDEGEGTSSLSPSDLRTSERKQAWPRRRWTSRSISEGGCLMVYCPWWEGCSLTFRGGQWLGVGNTSAVGYVVTQRALEQHLGHSWAFSEGRREGQKEIGKKKKIQSYLKPRIIASSTLLPSGSWELESWISEEPG